jgi:hypothetical protein
VNVWKLLQDRKDVAQETLADPTAVLADKDEAGAEAATVHYAIHGPCDGSARR